MKPRDTKYPVEQMKGVSSIIVIDTKGNKVRWKQGDKKWSNVNE